jgi:hypothetical protein
MIEVAKQAEKSIKQFIGTWVSLGKRDLWSFASCGFLLVDFLAFLIERKLILAFDRLGSTRSIGVGRIRRASDTF